MTSARKSVILALVLSALVVALTGPTTAQAAFGVQAFSATALNRDGSTDLEAASHPFEYVVHLSLNGKSSGELEGIIRDLTVDLPPGLVGNPQAIPRCSGADFEGNVPNCPGNTQIGVVEVQPEGLAFTNAQLYNLARPKGVAARLGASLFGVTSFQDASVRADDYGVSIADLSLPTVTAKIQSVTERIWGVPADPSHDADRLCHEPSGKPIEGCSSELGLAPFLTLPTSCTGPLKTTITVHSVAEPTVDRSATTESLDSGGNPAGLSSCAKVPFKPTVTVQPETNAASSPTGLRADIHVPQNQDASQPATAHLRDAVVNLPRGLVLNPSTADGLSACALQGPEGINLSGSPEPGAGEGAKCPSSSKVGTVSVDTPLLDHPLPGTIYIARQFENPFRSLVALYIAIEDPETGVFVKIPGKVEPDPTTGQLRATFVNNPQLPFEDLHVDFEGGPRAALTTPAVCGTYITGTVLTPWSAPEGADAFPSDSFQIVAGPRGGACPKREAEMPNAPSFEAGTTAPLAGSYSPFTLRITREEGSQPISSLDTTLPAGLLGKLAGIPYCSEAQIARAKARSNPGEGAAERLSPSCPATSEVGTVTVGAGSGSPLYVQGHAYLAGPYKGAPLSLEIVTPAIAGPFDLGDVVVRTALYVNQATAQIHAVSDPIPTILSGIPLDVRSIAIELSRPNFVLNPTNCDPMAVLGSTTSTLGQVAPLRNRFQVGGCSGLDFAPKLALKLSGSTQRGKNPALRAVLTQPSGQANISRVSVVLPKSEFIDNRHINNPCTRVQFNAGAGNGAECPAKSILGHARAFTPLLDKPLEGPVYFRSNGGERELPDLVASLDGQVHLNLVGFIDSVHKKGTEVSRTRNTFAMVPDAPVSKFVLELKGGKSGLLQNSANLCKVKNVAQAKFTGQNGKPHNLSPTVANSCKKKGKKSAGMRGK